MLHALGHGGRRRAAEPGHTVSSACQAGNRGRTNLARSDDDDVLLADVFAAFRHGNLSSSQRCLRIVHAENRLLDYHACMQSMDGQAPVELLPALLALLET